jgi:hypothetical protein
VTINFENCENVDATSRIDQLQADGPADIEAVEAAMKEAVRDALVRHKQAGNPIATWQDDRVQWIAAEDIDLTEFEATAGDPTALFEHGS